MSAMLFTRSLPCRSAMERRAPWAKHRCPLVMFCFLRVPMCLGVAGGGLG